MSYNRGMRTTQAQEGEFDDLKEKMRYFLVRGSMRENFLDPTKIILVVSLRNVQ